MNTYIEGNPKWFGMMVENWDSDQNKPEKIFHGVIWPFLVTLEPLGLIDRIGVYLGIKLASDSPKEDFTLEVGAGAIPFYKIYNRGEIVLVDWQTHLLRINRVLSKILHLRGKNDVDYVVADNGHLPFRQDAFDKVTSAFGFENSIEELRVLKRDGIVLNQWSWGESRVLKKTKT